MRETFDEDKRFVLRPTEDAKKREQIHKTTVLQIYAVTSPSITVILGL